MRLLFENLARRRKAEADTAVRRARWAGYLMCVWGALQFALAVCMSVAEPNFSPRLPSGFVLMFTAVLLLFGGGQAVQGASVQKRFLKIERTLEELRLEAAEKGK